MSAACKKIIPVLAGLKPPGRAIGRLRNGLPGLLGSVLVFFAAAELNGVAAVSLDNTYRVSRYEIRGNTVLEPEATRSLFTNAVGTAVTLGCICRTLAALRQAYQQRGYIHVTVALPEQQLTNGVVLVDVIEGPPRVQPANSFAGAISAATAHTNPPAPAAFEVQRFRVVGNTVLSPAIIGQVITNVGGVFGTNVTFAGIRTVLTSLQKAYRERGYATVAVSLPAQRLTNATVHLLVTEGRLETIEVTGNRYFSSNNIIRALPSLQTNTIINSHVLQRELDAANQNRDRQIYPTLGPGLDPGTSALILRVNDRPPLHAHLEMDNYSTPGTPDLRVNAAAQYNNLWQREQQFGLAYSFSPQQFKTMGNTPDFGFNQPLISSYSAFYRLPLPGGETVSDQIAGSTKFGYQEATHQFLLPPASSPSELILYASASGSDTGVKWGAPTVVSESSLLSIVSQDSGQNLTDNQNVGGQFRFPLISREHSSWSGSAGLDYKRFDLASYNANNFFITTITTNLFGAETNRSAASTAQPVVNQEVVYFPVNLGLNFTESDPGGSTAAGLELSGNFTANNGDFAKAAYSTNAQALYAKAILSANRDQKLPAGCSLFVRANGQAATGALINDEQFALGGINSVRGYYEGDEYGDCGWSGSLELRSPYFQTQVAGISRSFPTWLRASVFTDGGQRFLLEPNSAAATASLWSTGLGLSANINNHLDARLVIAWPLLTSANTLSGTTHAYFTIGGQF